MIGFTRFRAAVLALLVTSSFAVGACVEKCNAVGCTSGLTIQLYGDVGDGGVVLPLQIDFATLVGQTFVPFMTCTLAAGTDGPSCTSDRFHTESGQQIHLAETDIRMLQVKYSMNGNPLSEEVVAPSYTSAEVWGEGCGFCRQASVRITLPHP
jgi:hypothetical protein